MRTTHCANLARCIAQKPRLLTRAAAAALKGAPPSTPIDLTATSPISVEEDGFKFKISPRDERDQRKAHQVAQLAVWHAEKILAEAEIKAGQTRLKHAKRQYQAIVEEMGMGDVPLGSTDGEPRTKRPKSSRGRGGKAKATSQATAIPGRSTSAASASAVKGKGKAQEETA